MLNGSFRSEFVSLVATKRLALVLAVSMTASASLSEAGERVTNGSFGSSTGWTKWVERGSTSENYNYSGGDCPSGGSGACLRVDASGNYNGGYWQQLSLVAGQNYTLAGYGKDWGSNASSAWGEIHISTAAPVNGSDYTAGQLVKWDTFSCNDWNGSVTTGCIQNTTVFNASSGTMYLVLKGGQTGGNPCRISWDSISVNGPDPCSPPAAPTGGNGNPQSSSQITWSWTPAAASGEVYRVYNASSGGSLMVSSAADASNVTEGSLSANTLYTRWVATDLGSCESLTRLALPATYTLANTPSAPTVGGPTVSSLDVNVNPNGNPAATTFAIVISGGAYSGDNDYVNASGGVNVNGAAVWQTDASWGNKTVTGLAASTLYTFKVKARNGVNIETVLGSSASGTTSAPGGGLCAGNVVTNADFSSGSSGWTNWHERDGGGTARNFSSSNAPSGGTSPALQISNTGNFNGGVYQTLSLSAGQTYDFAIEGRDLGTNTGWQEIVITPTQPVNGVDTAAPENGGAANNIGMAKWQTGVGSPDCGNWDGDHTTACFYSKGSFTASASTMYIVLKCGNNASGSTVNVAFDNVEICPQGGGCPNPTVTCQNLTRDIASDGTYQLQAAQAISSSSPGSGCTIALTEIARNDDNIFGGNAMFDCSDVGNVVPVTVRVTQSDAKTATCGADITIADPGGYCSSSCGNPTADCEPSPAAAINGAGTVTLTANDIDRNSVADTGNGCSLSLIEVSRDGSNFDNDVTFNCGDVNSNVQVTLRVQQDDGKTDTCTTFVAVTDPGSNCAGSCPNLLVNGDFENGKTGWTDWSTGSGALSNTTVAGDTGHGQALSLSTSTSRNGSFGVYQVVNVTPGKTYEIDAYWMGQHVSGNDKWAEILLIDGGWSLTEADSPPTVVNNFMYAYDGGQGCATFNSNFGWVWAHDQNSDNTIDCPHDRNGRRTATGSQMTVVLKTGNCCGTANTTVKFDDVSLVEVGCSGPIDRTLNITAGTGGTIAQPASSPHVVADSTVVTIEAQALPGYVFDEWTGDISTVNDANSALTTITMSANYTIQATFTAVPTGDPANKLTNPTFASGMAGWTSWTASGSPSIGAVGGELSVSATGTFVGGAWQQFNTGGAGKIVTVVGNWRTAAAGSGLTAEVLIMNSASTPSNGSDVSVGGSNIRMFRNTNSGGWNGSIPKNSPGAYQISFTASSSVATIVLRVQSTSGSTRDVRYDNLEVRCVPATFTGFNPNASSQSLPDGFSARSMTFGQTAMLSIAQDPVSKDIYCISNSQFSSGDNLYRVNTGGGSLSVSFIANVDHASGFAGGAQGLAFDSSGNLYVSSRDGDIVRCTPGNFGNTGAYTQIINISQGGLATNHGVGGIAVRNGTIYINAGSKGWQGEVGESSVSARILQANATNGSGLSTFAEGIRNSFDITFRSDGSLFGVENGPATDCHYAEEFHLISSGNHYGYPYKYGGDISGSDSSQYACTTWSPSGIPAMPGGLTVTGAWGNYGPSGVPAPGATSHGYGNGGVFWGFHAHSSPTGVTFYEPSQMDPAAAKFPPEFHGRAFVTRWGELEGLAHGSVGHDVLSLRLKEDDDAFVCNAMFQGLGRVSDVLGAYNGKLYIVEFNQQTSGTGISGSNSRLHEISGSYLDSCVPDTTPPSITCPSTVNVSVNTGSCVATGVNLGAPVANDSCSTPNVTNNAPGSYPIGATVVTWTATDVAGNSATCTQTVNVSNTAPVITQGAGPVALNVGQDTLCANVANQLTFNATDPQHAATLSWSITGGQTSGSAAFVGGMTGSSVTVCYQPNGGQSNPDSFTVNVSDGCGGSDSILVNVTVTASCAAPSVVSANSIKTHGGAGDFPIPLGIAPASGTVESRLNGSTRIEVQFSTNIVAADGTFNAGAGQEVQISTNPASAVTVNNITVVGGNVLRIDCDPILDRTCLSVLLHGIACNAGGGSPGSVMPDTTLRQVIVFGDVTGDGQVTGADRNAIKSQTGPVDGGNFKSDLNLNGKVTTADINFSVANLFAPTVSCP